MVEKGGYFTEKDTSIFAKYILMLLRHFGHLKIVHRDLSGMNLMAYEANGHFMNLKVIDYGSATRFNPLKKLTEIRGTPQFIAPEVYE